MFALASLVISRAGANAICELLALHKPNILIPLSAAASRGPMLLPLKTAALILHLDTNTHADLRQLCNTCSTCKNLSSLQQVIMPLC